MRGLAQAAKKKARACPQSRCASGDSEWAWLDVEVCLTPGKKPRKLPPIAMPGQAAAIFYDLYAIEKIPVEKVMVLCLSSAGRPIAAAVVTVGTLNSSLVHPREVLRPAVMLPAASIIISHNHPSGDLKPSLEDVEMTARIKEAAKIVGIRLLDHVIVSPDSPDKFYSFSTEGKL